MITAFVVRNFKAISLVKLKKEDLAKNVVVISGKNSVGKSTVLESMASALLGDRALPERPVKEGESHATVEVEIDENLKAEKTIVYSGPKRSVVTKLVVWDKKGEVVPRPQTLLNKMWGDSIAWPLKIVNATGKERMETLKKALGLDFSSLEAERMQMEEERRETGRKAQLTKGELQAYRGLPESPQKMRDADTVMKELSDIDLIYEQERRQAKEDLERRDRLEGLRTEHRRVAAKINEKEQMVMQINREILEAKAKAKQLLENIANGQKALDSSPEREDHEAMEKKRNALKTELKEIHGQAELVEKIRTRDRLQKRQEEQRSSYAQYSEQIREIDKEKARLLRETKFPVEGMSFGDSDITFHGIPFSGCSTSEKLKMSIGINAQLNPKMKIMFIEDGSCLDDNSFAELDRIAKAHNYQIIIEKVLQTNHPEQLVIENGEIVRTEDINNEDI